MTRKDYEVIADILGFVQNQVLKGHIDNDEDIIPMIARAFCEDAKLDKPRFKADKFLSRAGVDV
jgi:hypothetical protein